MKLKLPPVKLKKKVLKKKKGAAVACTVSTADADSCRLIPSSVTNIDTNANATNNANTAKTNTSLLDDGRPSLSALNDLHRVLKLIEAERHLAAYQLYTHVKERIIVSNNNDNAAATTTSSSSSTTEDTSLASARTLLNGSWHEFRMLERRSDIFGNAKINLSANNQYNDGSNSNSSSWILAQTLFGITTYYRREPIDNSLSIKIEGELSDVDIPLFEQIVVLRECDLYHIWAPFMTKSRKLAQLDKFDVVAWYEVGVPLLGLMRDACYRAVGCDCMKEDGTVLLVAVGLNDSEEHGVKKNSLSSSNNDDDDDDGTIHNSNGDVDGDGGEEIEQLHHHHQEQGPSKHGYVTTDSNLVTDTVASSFLARDEILETIEIPPIPTGTGKGRMTIRNFAASIDVLGPIILPVCGHRRDHYNMYI